MTPSGSGNGTPITGYVVYRKHKITGTFSQVAVVSADYDLEYQMTVVTDGLVVGDHYFFHYTLRNSEGDSEISDEAEFLLSDYPQAPNAPTKVDQSSTLTSISLTWDLVANT